MATSKTANQKAAVKRNSYALKGFPKAKLKAALTTISGHANDAEASTEQRQAAALDFVMLADEFRHKNNEADVKTVADGWRESLQPVVMELAIAGNRFADLTAANGDKPASAKLTGYGSNVASIAKGVIEFDLVIAGKFDSYREVRTEVETKRAEARRSADPAAAALADAKQATIDAWDALRKLVFETEDIANVVALRNTIDAASTEVTQQLLAQADIEAEANPEQDAEGMAEAA